MLEIEQKKFVHIRCLDTMARMPDNFVDMVITSPPYDKLRDYHGYKFEFRKIARELFRVIKEGGALVWVVADQIKDGDKTATSFKQTLYFKKIGFTFYDAMIWNKNAFSAIGTLKTRYAPVYEFMMVFAKGKMKTFNPIKDRPTKSIGKKTGGALRQKDGSMKRHKRIIMTSKYSQRYNIWMIGSDSRVRRHPAVFPLPLARDHIISWSNRGDLVYDPCMGSGTTAKACINTGRNFIGRELSEKYCKFANRRISGLRDLFN